MVKCVYVYDSIYDEFVEVFVLIVKSVKVDEGMVEGV